MVSFKIYTELCIKRRMKIILIVQTAETAAEMQLKGKGKGKGKGGPGQQGGKPGNQLTLMGQSESMSRNTNRKL